MSTPIPTLQVKPGYKPRAGWAQELAIQGIEKTVKKREKLEQELRKRHRELNTFPKRLIPGDITFDLSMTPILTRTTLPTELEELEPPPLPPKKGIHKPIARGPFKVAIVGAGAAGLFTGMIFDYLNQQNKAGSHGFLVEYEILESASTAGGRLSTYNFKTGLNGADDGAHVYYDVGAMRFPNNPVMTRTFDLFKFLGMKMQDSDVNDKTPVGTLIPYYMKNLDPHNPTGREFFHFNDTTKWGDIATINSQAPSYDPFFMNYKEEIPSGVLASTPDNVMNKAIENIRSELKNPGPKAWKILMDYDKCTTRQYLLGNKYVAPPESPGKSGPQPPPIPDQPYNWETINWLETFNGGTNWYDQALSETVLESMDFDYPGIDTKWWCILGGANLLAQKMKDQLTFQPTFGVRVTGIETNYGIQTVDSVNTMRVRSKPTMSQDEPKLELYAGVFNSTSFGCMRQMNIETNLNYPTKEAMRVLGYGPSAKVGILFESAWWIHDLGDFNVSKGGLGHSDLTIRTCVYPSYNYYVPNNTRAVLLCSYTWQQDAERIGSLMASTNGPNLLTHKQIKEDEVRLKDLVLYDLARMHTGHPGSKYTTKGLYEFLQKSYVDHYAHDWMHDPNTAGAFAFFRPQQFSTLWPELIVPTSDLITIGEAASPHHAWVVGALESAVHGVYSWISMNQHRLPGAEEAMSILSKPVEGDPFVGLPDYMPVSTAQWHGFMGAMAKEDYLWENKLIKEAKEAKEKEAKEAKAEMAVRGK